METRNALFDILVLPPLVVAHCVIVFIFLCLYTYLWLGAHFLFHVDAAGVTIMVATFVLPPMVALVAALINYRYILGNVARTRPGREIAALAIFLYAIAPPFYMFLVDFIVGCHLQKWFEGKCVSL